MQLTFVCYLVFCKLHKLISPVVFFFLDSLGFSTYEILSHVNQDSFTSFFSTCMFFCLPIKQSGTSCTMLTTNDEIGHHFCFHSKRKICQLDIVSMILTGQLS